MLRTHWWAVAVVSLLAGGVSLLGLAGGRWWGFDLLNNFQAQYFGFQLLCLLVLLGLRRFRWALLPVMFMIQPGWRLAPYYLPCDNGPASVSQPLRVLTFNVLFTNTRWAETVRWVQSADPDVAFFPEVNFAWEKGLEPLKATMPHTVLFAQTHNFGFAVFSKHPIVEHSLIPSSVLGMSMVQLTLQIGERRVVFVGVHPSSPLSAGYSRSRDASLNDLAQRLRPETGPVIVVGDFNATPWSHAMRPLAQAGMRDAMWGRGYSATWNRWLLPIAIPIDHVLIRGPIRVQACGVGPNLGSDHRPLVADLRW